MGEGWGCGGSEGWGEGRVAEGLLAGGPAAGVQADSWGPNLPQQEDDEPQQQQPGPHGHKHQPQLDLGGQLLHQLGVNIHGELEGVKGLSPVSTPQAPCSCFLAQRGP